MEQWATKKGDTLYRSQSNKERVADKLTGLGGQDSQGTGDGEIGFSAQVDLGLS
jgi:hypothetical protein